MNEQEETGIRNTRPFFMSLLCIAAFVYSVVFALINITGILFRDWIISFLTDYIPEKHFDEGNILIVCITGTLLYALSFTGVIYMWKLKRPGFYIYGITTLLIIFIPYIFGLGNIITSVVLGLMLILFSLFYRRFH